MSILGNRVTRSEDPRFITGTATFGEDVDLPGVLHATFVRSVIPHGRIRSIDTSAVSATPGARVFTAAGGPGGEAAGQGTTIDLPVMPHAMPGLNEKMTRPVIAADTVRYAGEIVAVVVTEDGLRGPDAAELVMVDYDDLEPLPDLQAAAAPRAARRSRPSSVRGSPAISAARCAGPRRGAGTWSRSGTAVPSTRS